ncbi:helix-turn-helix domain-containing protein [Verrucomicrobia bacterium]|nr:helix-turn-helix domain-containing protein [Verrucomicrobiota bacterium]
MSLEIQRDELLKKWQLARKLNLSQRTIENFMRRGWIPYVKIGKKSVRFCLADVLATLKARGQVNTVLGGEVRR